MGIPHYPRPASIHVMAAVLAENGGLVPANLEPSVANHIQMCFDYGLLRRKPSSVWIRKPDGWEQLEVDGLVPTQQGWERVADWSWDETGRKALSFRP
jgi:hypothetical protein